MTGIRPTGRLRELAKLLGTGKEKNTKHSEKTSVSEPAAEETLHASLKREIRQLDLTESNNRSVAKRLIINKVLAERMSAMSLDAAQLSHLSNQVFRKAEERQETKELLDAVLEELHES